MQSVSIVFSEDSKLALVNTGILLNFRHLVWCQVFSGVFRKYPIIFLIAIETCARDDL
jgi:hypothetical protein